jgi:hypothetical protein
MKSRKFLRIATTILLLMLVFSLAMPGYAAGPGYWLYLPLVSRPDNAVPVASVLTPFNADLSDQSGPASWSANYGKTPEIIAAPNGTGLDVLAQDYDPSTPWTAVLLHIEPNGSGGYKVTQALTGLPMLDRVMGLAVDADGNRYYATAVDENNRVNASYPPNDTYRSDIVRVVKLDPSGGVLFNIDLDTARHAFNPSAEMIINPMVAATARLAVGGGEIALTHGINTGPDSNLGGRRHQKALSTRLNAATGAVTQTSSIWVSHSFDERLLYDGSSILEMHLGDAYPRYIALGAGHSSFPLFYIKGALGENLTATRLGNMALIQNDPVYGYLALFASENSTINGTMYGTQINGPRNLAVVRINRSDKTVDTGMPDSQTVSQTLSAGPVQKTNHLKWLTQYTPGSNKHVERPKLIALGADQYIALWEEWLYTGQYDDTFNGVYGMRIDANGSTLHAPTLLSSHHMPRGDDAFLFNGQAAWITGDDSAKSLTIHLVDSNLVYTTITLN